MSVFYEVMRYGLIFHRQRVVYVPVPKAACTSIKTYLFRREGLPANTPKDVHNLRVSGLDVLSHLSAVRFAEMVYHKATRYHVFTMVRHPITRVVSAYTDKIAGLSAAEAPPGREADLKIAEPVMLHVAKLRDIRLRDVQDVTFEEFVDYIAETPPLHNNRHWQVQMLLLRPKVIRYESVLRMEDLKPRPNLVPRTLGHDGAFSTHLNPNPNGSAKPKVTPEVRARLLSIYARDFKQFEYDPDDVPR